MTEPDKKHTQDLQGNPAQRRQFRLPKNYVVEVKKVTFPSTENYDIVSHSNDISVGGLNVSSPYSIPLGTMMQVRITIPMLNRFSSSFFKYYENDMEQYLVALAEVAWVKPDKGAFAVGLTFIDIDQTNRDALNSLINKARLQLEDEKKTGSGEIPSCS